MTGERDSFTDRDVERVISRLLLVGVSAAACVVLTGGALYLARHGHEPPRLGSFQGEPDELRTLAGLAAGARHFEARALIQLGLGILVATPVARVGFSLYAFVRQRDWLYALVTSFVLGVLLLSMFSALALSR